MNVARQMVPTMPDFRQMVRLAFPVAVVQVGLVFMGVVDTIMVGHVSALDLGAVGLGNMYFFTMSVFGMGVLFSLDPVISQAHGAGDTEAIARAVQRGGILALVLGLLASLLLVPAVPILTVLRQPDELIPIAAAYAWATIPGVFPFYGFIVFRQSLQAMGMVAPIVVVILSANVANAFFNWVLIYGNLGFPAMGAVGAGWATSLSRWFMFFGIIGVAWPLLKGCVRPVRAAVFEREPLVRLLRLGAPIGAQFFLEFGVFGMIGLLMGWLGTIQIASHQVALNLSALTFMLSVGITQATAVLVGQAVGSDDPGRARRAAGAGLLLSVGLMSVSAVLFLTIPEVFARIYTSEVEVAVLAALLLPISGVFQIFDGIQTVSSGILRGVGDTKAPMIANLLGFWCVGFPVSLWLGFARDWGAVGLWWGLAAGIAAVAVFLLARVRVRMGRELRRLEVEGGHASRA